MSSADCPHCGERNFTVVAWSDLDRCASCGRSLAADATVTLDVRVREAIVRRARFTRPGGTRAVRTIRPAG
jgi:hypothetical protein